MNKYIIYPDANWEKQFIFQDLLNIDTKIYKKIIYTNRNLRDFDLHLKSFQNINEIINNNILVFQSNQNKYHTILNLVKFLKPIIIIHLSDEWGTKEEFQGLNQYTKLVLRQYYHSNYYQKPNIKYIPLGYMTNMLESEYMNKQLKLPNERKYKLSFIGDIKQDRQEMINKMKLITPHYFGKTDVHEIKNIYRDSIFVPNGRGNIKLDCFRLYEASLCGAIPIIVGSKKEFEDTFCKEENPPWLRFDSWDDAYINCLELLKDMDKLDKMSKDVINWWKNRVRNLRKLISDYL